MRTQETTTDRVNRFLMGMRQYKKAYYGWPYMMLFILLLTLEVLIAFNYYTHFIRAYVGDVLAVILLYCLIRAFADIRHRLVPWVVFGFAIAVEISQLLGLVEWLGAQPESFLWVVLGSTFSWGDMISYLAGALIAGLILEAENDLIRPWWQRCLAWVRNHS